MTETTHPPHEAASERPSGILLSLIVAFLTRMFHSVTAGDIDLARLAAIETVNAYPTRSQADLIAVAQVIACGLASLGSLSRSMDDDISLSMALRLRGNAVSLSRSAEQHRRTLPTAAHKPPETAAPPATSTKPPIPPQARTQAATPPIRTMTGQDKDKMWAAAMIEVAEEFAASIPGLPPEEREMAVRRAAVLNRTADQLKSGSQRTTSF
jgi:hypothetical protein